MDSLILFIVLVILIVVFVRMFSGKNKGATPTAAQAKQSEKQQLIEDIKSTRTSRVVDEVEILRDLSATSSNFRQYCELVGTTMADSDLVAPYSKKKVAYYDVRCYRIDNVNGTNKETLVAHETSVDPFYFTDASCDTRVYVDFATFGANTAIINSCNRVQGPDSEFTKNFNKQAGIGGTGNAYAMTEKRMSKEDGPLASLRARLARPAYEARLAYAGASAADMQRLRHTAKVYMPSDEPKGNVMFAGGFGGGHGGGFGGGFGGGPGGGFGGGNLGSFLGGPGSLGNMGGGMGGHHGYGNFGGSQSGYYGRSSNPYGGGMSTTGMLTGLMLGQLLSSLSTAVMEDQSTPVQKSPRDTFLGYRIIEDIVPLNYPVYSLGEIYLVDDQVHVGRSLTESQPSSYFATKPEAELLNHLSK